MSVGDAIRAEAKRRHADGETKSLAQLGIWMKAAEFADSQESPAVRDTELEVLAEALRAHNIRHHDLPVWDEIDDHVREIWMNRAKQTMSEIEQIRERRGMILRNLD